MARDRLAAGTFDKAEWDYMMDASQYQQANRGQIFAQHVQASENSPYTSPDQLKAAINSRMRGSPKFDFLQPFYVAKRDTVVVFIIHNGEPVIVEDEFNLFPSDAFVTKLRLMLG